MSQDNIDKVTIKQLRETLAGNEMTALLDPDTDFGIVVAKGRGLKFLLKAVEKDTTTRPNSEEAGRALEAMTSEVTDQIKEVIGVTPTEAEGRDTSRAESRDTSRAESRDVTEDILPPGFKSGLPPGEDAEMNRTGEQLRSELKPHEMRYVTRNGNDEEGPFLLIAARGDAAQITYGTLKATGVIIPSEDVLPTGPKAEA